MESLKAKDFEAHYEPANPGKSNCFSLRPSDVAAQYLAWPTLAELSSAFPFNGLFEKRGNALIDIDKEALTKRVSLYFDKSIVWETLKH